MATGPLALVAHQSTPYRSFQDVVAAAKAAPDTISYASSGVGGLAHVSTTLLQQQGGFSLVHVPYRGGGPAVQDAVAGHVPLFMSNVVIICQHIRAGTLRPLGVTTRDREPARARRRSPSPSRASPASRRRPGGPSSAAPARRSRSWSGCAPPWPRRCSDPEVKARIEEQGADVVASDGAAATALLLRRGGEVGRGDPLRGHPGRRLRLAGA